jgi:hypothetical protein
LRNARSPKLDLEVLYGDGPVGDPYLYEAECLGDGDRLGPVGGYIVAEVIVGLLRADDTSYLSENGWQPTLPHEDEFSMADLILMAEAARQPVS